MRTKSNAYAGSRYAEPKYNQFRTNKARNDKEDIAALRKELGMITIKEGHKECRRCGRDFYADDMVTQIWCCACKEVQRRIHD